LENYIKSLLIYFHLTLNKCPLLFKELRIGVELGTKPTDFEAWASKFVGRHGLLNLQMTGTLVAMATSQAQAAERMRI
jgi:hypothetical protein